jgi:Tannase and feruloyl esterase
MRVSSGQLTIVSAELVVAAGDVPEFCRVIGTIRPEVKFEVALPTAWNRRLYMRGNGGYAGEPLDQPPRIAQRNAALRNGFVAAQTNTGHDAAAEPLGSFAVRRRSITGLSAGHGAASGKTYSGSWPADCGWCGPENIG